MSKDEQIATLIEQIERLQREIDRLERVINCLVTEKAEKEASNEHS